MRRSSIKRREHAPRPLTARDLLKALQRRHLRFDMERHQWALVADLRVGPNLPTRERLRAKVDAKLGRDSDWEASEDTARTLDAWAMHTERDYCITYEIKASRADFNRELTEPAKRAPGLVLSNEFFFVAEQGVIDVDEIPAECGLMEVVRHTRGGLTSGLQTYIKKPAPWREMEELPRSFIASLAIKAS